MAEWVKYVVLTGLFARAVYTDVRWNRIGNSLIGAGMMAGLGLAGIQGGIQGMVYSLKMAGSVLLALIFLFIVRGLGAGDIKLLCVASVFFPERAWSIVVMSFLAGGFIAVAGILVRWRRGEPIRIREQTIHFSIPIAVGTLLTFI